MFVLRDEAGKYARVISEVWDTTDSSMEAAEFESLDEAKKICLELNVLHGDEFEVMLRVDPEEGKSVEDEQPLLDELFSRVLELSTRGLIIYAFSLADLLLTILPLSIAEGALAKLVTTVGARRADGGEDQTTEELLRDLAKLSEVIEQKLES